MKNNKVIYSALVGMYDDIPKHKYNMDDWDYVLFTDACELKEKNGWRIKPLKYMVDNQGHDNNTKTARWHKTNPHELFPNYEYSVWIDTNINILDNTLENSLKNLIENNVEISTIKHPVRNCTYEEATACELSGKDEPQKIVKIVNYLREENFPEKFKLFETGILFRKHNQTRIKKLDKLWWTMIEKHCRRDQLSFPYSLWKNDINCHYLFGENNIRDLPGFSIKIGHKAKNNSVSLKEIRRSIIQVKFKKNVKFIKIFGLYLLKIIK